MFNLNFYLKTLKSHLRNPNFYPCISLLHSPPSKKSSLSNPAIQFILDEAQEFGISKPPSSSFQTNLSAKNGEEILPHKNCDDTSKIQISHPWPEWMDLMEKLLKNGYFEGIGNPFGGSKGEMGTKEANVIRTACLNFARDNYHLIRYLSREDIMVVAGSGCPSTDRKIVNSGKRLRAHVGIDEGNACSSCILRGDCERAYVKAREDEGGRTVDVMRFVLAYGLDPVYCSVDNKPCLNKRVKESVRILLKEMMDVRA
ncbi:zinc finger protein VAR3 [Forsythia ovata]|uniref:Zinc finger protein VAR3 n=1 Tax=Forsythia ovata TaxID=205694 RepID=A0ABD1W8R2_9LAMI